MVKCADNTNVIKQLMGVVKDFPDFPRKGILFKDIMPLFRHHDLVDATCSILKEQV